MVHRLELLRHAKSSRGEPGLPDRDRPLAPRGVKASARLREHLLESRLAVDLVLCSSAMRAVQTWNGIREGISGAPRRPGRGSLLRGRRRGASRAPQRAPGLGRVRDHRRVLAVLAYLQT